MIGEWRAIHIHKHFGVSSIFVGVSASGFILLVFYYTLPVPSDLTKMYQGSGNKENTRSDFSKKCLIVKKNQSILILAIQRRNFIVKFRQGD